jgi:hypothetical protein
VSCSIETLEAAKLASALILQLNSKYLTARTCARISRFMGGHPAQVIESIKGSG